MNNQAAQTMPELPDSQYRGGNDVFGKEFPLYTADQMHQYARDYAAALSQTAGVPDGWRSTVEALVRHIESETCTHEETHRGGAIWEICDSCGAQWADDRGGRPEFTWPECVENARSMLAAAPAASGGEDGLVAGIMAHFCNAIDNLNDMPVSDEWARKWTAKAEFLIGMGPDPGDQSLSDTPTAPHPDALPDGTLSKSTAKRVTALAAASVSERARELLATEYDKIGLNGAATYIRSGEHGELDKAIIRALEQALTQQREEDSDLPFATTQRVVRALLHLGHGVPEGQEEQYARSNELVLTLCSEVMSTTPQPSADAVRELVNRWRISASAFGETEYSDGARDAFSQCARELESLLSAASGEKGVG